MTPERDSSKLEKLVNILRHDPKFIRNITAWRTLTMRDADSGPWPTALSPRLREVGQQLGITTLYTHQLQAVEAALRGENVIMATGTASGKTLGYVLPVLNQLLKNPNATALFVFPTKALAHDQIAALQRWIGSLNAPIALRPYDGDTPQRHRATIRREARILVTNPDMLHLGILPHHTRWSRFFQGLGTIVLDELHTYRGVFGGHVANVLRRLRRVTHFYGAAPRLIASSATIGNPQALAEALWEDSVKLIAQDGAPYGQRHVLFYNPPLLNPTLGLRASATREATGLAMRLLNAGVQTILFARARVTVELLLREIRARAARAGFDPACVQGYRGGYLPHERRSIERGLREGEVRVVIATNALELGIDIGALDAAILVGYPGSIAATHQQMGRAGRRSGTSIAVLIATPSPLDQYLVGHPEYFFGTSPEEARLNPNSLSLLSSHLACAAFELPFERDERFGDSTDLDALLEVLSAEGILHQGNEQFTWIGEGYPAQIVSLRSATADNVIVQASEPTADESAPDQESKGSVRTIATVDRPSAPFLVHEGAVYFHSGASYVIESLDWDRGLAHARPAELDTYTIATGSVKVERLTVRREAKIGSQDTDKNILTDEDVLVHTKYNAYRRVHAGTRETLGWGEIDLPEQLMETEAFRLSLGQPVVEALAEHGVMVAPLDYGDEWPGLRKQILERDAHQCRICSARAQPERPLEVHHITPLRTFMAQYPRAVALRMAHAPENLLTLCPTCHRQVEKARGARTALSGLATLLRTLAPVFLMCDPGDLGTSVQARDAETGQPAVVLYDAIPGGAGLTPRILDIWARLAQAALERVRECACVGGCPSCIGPTGENEAGAKAATHHLLQKLMA